MATENLSAGSDSRDLQSAIERVSAMENALDQLVAANRALEQALESYAAAQDGAAELADYLASDLWISDFEADEAGAFPSSLKRGVLSEDAAFDALEENYANAVALIETAARTLKN